MTERFFVENLKQLERGKIPVSYPSMKSRVKSSLKHLTSETTATEEEFLRTWTTPLHPIKWSEYILSWSRALSAYKTPATIVNDVVFSKAYIPTAHGPWGITIRGGSYYANRHKLMDSQKPYLPAFENYPYDLDPNCPLCRNSARVYDAATLKDRSSPAIFEIDDYVLLPNRYPGMPGAALLLSKNHDDIISRTKATGILQERICEIAENKTRARLLASMDLYVLFLISDALNLVAKRNHTLSGMSIPLHDHFHLFPEDLPTADNIWPYLGLTEQELKIEELNNVPFAALRLSSSNPWQLAQTAAEITRNMEVDNQVFGLVYLKGNLFILPRFCEGITGTVIGGAFPFLDEGVKWAKHLTELYHKHIYGAGSYNWERYVPGMTTGMRLAAN
jgi:hypothetical protein